MNYPALDTRNYNNLISQILAGYRQMKSPIQSQIISVLDDSLVYTEHARIPEKSRLQSSTAIQAG